MVEVGTGDIWILLAFVTFWSVDRVVQPFFIVSGGLSKGVILVGDCSVKPCAIWLSWGHVAVIGAVESVVRCMIVE